MFHDQSFNLSEANSTIEQYQSIALNETITCLGDHGICHIQCYSASCTLGRISLNNKSIETLIIDCIGDVSCYQMKINTTDSNIENIHISCNRQKYCQEMDIFISDSYKLNVILRKPANH